MPEDYITLDNGSRISKDEWDKVSPEIQKKYKAPTGLLTSPGGTADHGQDFSSLASPEMGEKLFKMVTQNLPMAGVGAFAGGPLMGAAMGLMPPETAGQAGMNALGPLGGAIGSKIMQGMPEISQLGGKGNAFLQTALRGALGGVQGGMDTAIQGATGDEMTPGTNMALSMGLPMVAGGLASATKYGKGAARFNANKNVQDFQGQATGGAEDAFKNLQQQRAQQGASQASQVVPEAGPIQQEIAQSQQQTGQMAQAKAGQVSQNRATLAAMPTGSKDVDVAQKAAILSQNEKERTKWTELAQKFTPDPDQQEIKDLLSKRDEAEAQVGWNPFAKDRLTATEDQITAKLADVWSKHEQAFGQASVQAAQDLYNPSNPGVKTLQKAVDSVSNEAANNILEKVNLKKLVGVQGTDNATPKSFVSNLIKSDSDTIDSVFEHLNTDKTNGPGMVQGVRDAMVQEFFARAADPKTGKFSGDMAKQLMSGTGDFNVDKLEALFGRGEVGTQSANKFARFVSDLKALGDSQAAPIAKAGSSNPMMKAAKMVAFPTAILWPLAHGNMKGAALMAAAETALYGAGKVMSFPRIVDKIVNDGKFADAFHSWASSGGDMKTLMYSPVLGNWMNKNANKY